MCTVAIRSPAVSTRKPSPPKPARRAPSGIWASIAATSCHWCSVAVMPGDQRSGLECSRRSTSSLAGGPSAGKGPSDEGISASASSCVAVSKGRNGECLISAPRPPAARPAASLATSQPGPFGVIGGPLSSTESHPPGGRNGASSPAGAGSTRMKASSVTRSGLPSRISSQRSKMPSSASTATSTRSSGRRPVTDRSLMRGVATTRRASRPLTDAGPPGSRVKPVSSHDGRSSLAAAAARVRRPPRRTSRRRPVRRARLRSPSHPLR